MGYMYGEAIIMMIAYIGCVLYISSVNKKNNISIGRENYISSVFIALVSVLVECVIILCLEMIFDSFMSDGINAIGIAAVLEVFRLASFFISFFTIIIIIKLIVKCEISKKIWIILDVCIVISIVISIIQGMCLEDIFSDILEKPWGFLLFLFNPKILLVIQGELMYIISRCLLVILSTCNVVNQLLKKERKMNEV